MTMPKPRLLFREVLELDKEIARLVERIRVLQTRRNEIVRSVPPKPNYYRRKDHVA